MSRRIPDLLERAAVLAARALIALLARLPHAFVLGGFRLLADGAHALHIRRRVMMQNLDLVYGDRLSAAEKRRIARSALRNLFMTVAEMARSSHPLSRDEVALTLELEPRALFDSAAADPRGSLFAVAHSGNFDLCGLRFIHDYRRPLAVVMKPLGTKHFQAELVAARNSYGFEVLTTERGGVVQATADRLSKGACVCMLPDQFALRSGVVVDFLGVPASTHAGPALAALRAPGCRIFAAVDTRQDDGPRHVCHMREITDFQPSGDVEADVLALTRRIADEMSAIVLQHPGSYLWPHRRWRTRKRQRRTARRAAAGRQPG
jgi:KDO2-lipid IV(A) lauroyltransferase